MGKSIQYKALLFPYRKKQFILLFILALALMPCYRCSAQVIMIPADTAVDSNSHDHMAEQGNVITRKNTATSSIAQLDSTKTDTTNHTATSQKFLHSARKAAYLSAVLPGLGQAYNKRYWKIPIIYAGFGGFSYALYYTVTNFKGYRAAYRQQVALVPNIYASYNGIADAPTLKVYRDYFKKYLDISCIGISVWYLLNIVDATVDAHLMGWNLKDDLSVSWNPTLITSPNFNTAAGGVSVALHF